jgi:hypothetical protein
MTLKKSSRIFRGTSVDERGVRVSKAVACGVGQDAAKLGQLVLLIEVRSGTPATPGEAGWEQHTCHERLSVLIASNPFA